VKYKQDGSVDRYKARLVAKGFTQVHGLDYQETYSPVATMSTLRLLLAISAANNWFLHQLDVDNAFLHGLLSEEVYMKTPLGFKTPKPNQVCHLKKSIYGLKQASKEWFTTLSAALESQHYQKSAADHTLFIKNSTSSFTALLIYVDDIVLAGNNIEDINSIKAFLHSKFRIKDLGELKFFLGLEIARSTKGISLNQCKYALELLSDTGMLASKPSSIPMDPSTRLSKKTGNLLTENTSYRRLVGRLLYLTSTRPDISFSVQQLSQFLDCPTDTHMQAATRILRYIKSCPGKGLFFSSKSNFKLHTYSDSDWAGCPDSRRSVTGYCVFIGSSLISWRAKKQQTPSRSSTEAEYRALAATTCEIQWIHNLLKTFGVSNTIPCNLFCDNESAIHISHNDSFHERSKHIELDCHITRTKILEGLIKLLPVPATDQLADILTKPLPASPFHGIISKLGMIDIHGPACGGVLPD
jgi:hypothetical protein